MFLQTVSVWQEALSGMDKIHLLDLLCHFKGTSLYLGSTSLCVVTLMMSLKGRRSDDICAHLSEGAISTSCCSFQNLMVMRF